jgi:hypothetical protein
MLCSWPPPTASNRRLARRLPAVLRSNQRQSSQNHESEQKTRSRLFRALVSPHSIDVSLSSQTLNPLGVSQHFLNDLTIFLLIWRSSIGSMLCPLSTCNTIPCLRKRSIFQTADRALIPVIISILTVGHPVYYLPGCSPRRTNQPAVRHPVRPWGSMAFTDANCDPKSIRRPADIILVVMLTSIRSLWFWRKTEWSEERWMSWLQSVGSPGGRLMAGRRR